MLRAVCFKNFVKFKEHQSIVFQDDSPFLFIGENGSGKSSVLEGIRRCLTDKLSSSVSSSFDKRQLSYFICDFDLTSEKDRIISGYAVIPEVQEKTELYSTNQKDETLGDDKHECYPDVSAQKGQTPNVQHQSNSASTEEDKEDRIIYVQQFYKFAWRCRGNSESGKIYVNSMEVSTTTQGETSIYVKKKYELINRDLQRKLEKGFNEELKDADFESYLLSVCRQRENLNITEEGDDCEAILEELSVNIIFTFPLRSVGPLQWSESSRISRNYRQKNYAEAEDRCEIIKCFLEDAQGTKFHKETEQIYFKRITQSDDYNFVLKDGKISLQKGKYELLKAPEGILEAKIFSILMSNKTYKTLILEEPDKGMHPQFIERMLQIIRENKKEKRVLLTTHNKAFITPWTVPCCFVFRRIEDECFIISGKSIVSFQGKNGNMKRLRLLTADHISDILFARKVLFYEGDSEMLFLTELKNQVLAREIEIEGILEKGTDEYDRLKENLIESTFINMHTRDNRKFCKEISDKLKIAYIFLVDRDAVFKIMKEGKRKDERQQEMKAEEERTSADWCRIRNDLLKRNIFFWIDGKIDDMVRKMTECDEELKKSLENQKYKPEEKLFLGDSIESEHVRESVSVIMKHCKPENDLAEFIKLLQRDTYKTQ